MNPVVYDVANDLTNQLRRAATTTLSPGQQKLNNARIKLHGEELLGELAKELIPCGYHGSTSQTMTDSEFEAHFGFTGEEAMILREIMPNSATNDERILILNQFMKRFRPLVAVAIVEVTKAGDELVWTVIV